MATYADICTVIFGNDWPKKGRITSYDGTGNDLLRWKLATGVGTDRRLTPEEAASLAAVLEPRRADADAILTAQRAEGRRQRRLQESDALFSILDAFGDLLGRLAADMQARETNPTAPARPISAGVQARFQAARGLLDALRNL
jgi:hypothetical protein